MLHCAWEGLLLLLFALNLVAFEIACCRLFLNVIRFDCFGLKLSNQLYISENRQRQRSTSPTPTAAKPTEPTEPTDPTEPVNLQEPFAEDPEPQLDLSMFEVYTCIYLQQAQFN